MPTGVVATNARNFHQQMVHYLRRGIDYTLKGGVVDVGTIPAGSLIVYSASGVFVTQIFNGTANAINIGASTDPGQDNFGTAMSVAALGQVPLDEGVNISPVVAVDTKIQANLAGITGTPTAGTGVIMIAYVPNNDL